MSNLVNTPVFKPGENTFLKQSEKTKREADLAVAAAVEGIEKEIHQIEEARKKLDFHAQPRVFEHED